jgi:hypothetical protein
MNTATGSPFLIPIERRPAAIRSTSRRSSA